MGIPLPAAAGPLVDGVGNQRGAAEQGRQALGLFGSLMTRGFFRARIVGSRGCFSHGGAPPLERVESGGRDLRLGGKGPMTVSRLFRKVRATLPLPGHGGEGWGEGNGINSGAVF